MSYDFGDSYFDKNQIGYGGQNAHDVMATQKRAVLYVFHPNPTQFGDIELRSFQYHFDENFVSETQTINDLARRGSASIGSVLQDLRNQVNLADYIVPSFDAPLSVKTSRLSDRYRFILILTASPQSLISGNTIGNLSGSNQVRRIYTGYFEDEPFNPATFSSSRRTLNEHAVMIITHKTKTGVETQSLHTGPKTNIFNQHSENILNSTVAHSLLVDNKVNASNFYVMTPENCLNGIEVSEDGYSIAVPGAASSIALDKGSHVIPDILEQPTHNVSQIMRGMMQFQEDAVARNGLSSYRADLAFGDGMSHMDEGFKRMTLANAMSIPRSRIETQFDLDFDRRISPVDIDRLVSGQLEVIDFNLPRPMMYDTADQTQASFVNQYSFLIASVVGPIMNAAGLNAMQFEFGVRMRSGQADTYFRTHSAEPVYMINTESTIQQAKAVEVELTRGIFRTIFESKGDFMVAVSANSTGMTTVRLNLIGQGIPNYYDFEIPTCMGGLVSPIVGNLNTNTGNSEAIETLYGVATGTANASSYFQKNGDPFNDGFADQANRVWDENVGRSALDIDVH